MSVEVRYLDPMIRFLAGNVRFVDLQSACIDVGGVGYDVRMPLNDLARCSESGSAVELYIHTAVREDALELYGFFDADALSMFKRLLDVSGVGPKSALGILSGLPPSELVSAVLAGDEARLVKAPGVGKKTAARIILELQDRLRKDGLTGVRGPSSSTMTPHTMIVRDLESALLNLGYKQANVTRALDAVKSLIDEGRDLPVLLREALKHV